MSNLSKCRICLAEGAVHPIFEGIESKDGIYSKLFQCFKEKIEDKEGYPRNICESCSIILNTICDFIAKYKRSCKLLESGLIVVKTEVCSDNESDIELVKSEIESEICKNEPDSEPDWLEPLNDSLWNIPLLSQVKSKEKDITEIKKKLKSLKEINFKRKPVRKSHRKTNKVASSILEAEFDWNGESLKSSKMKKAKEEKIQKPLTRKKLDLPKPKQLEPPPPKLCDACGEVFKDSEKLGQHKLRKHNTGEPAKCPKCPRTLISQYYLKRHIRRCHDDKRSLICDTCGRGFAFRGELNSHIKVVHLKIRKKTKRIPCDKCNKDFVNAKSLLIHERSAHTGYRPAECTECGASFFHEDYLKEHMRLHTGETPFKCPICGRGYAQRGNMRSHISHNHRLADLSPEVIKNLKPSWFKFLKKP